MQSTFLHYEWSAPLGLSAPIWGLLALIGYFFYWRLALKR